MIEFYSDFQKLGHTCDKTFDCLVIICCDGMDLFLFLESFPAESPVRSPEQAVARQSSPVPPPSPDRSKPRHASGSPPCSGSVISPAEPVCVTLLSSPAPAPPSYSQPSIDSGSFWRSCNAAGCTQAIFTDFINGMNDICSRIQAGQASQEGKRGDETLTSLRWHQCLILFFIKQWNKTTSPFNRLQLRFVSDDGFWETCRVRGQAAGRWSKRFCSRTSFLISTRGHDHLTYHGRGNLWRKYFKPSSCSYCSLITSAVHELFKVKEADTESVQLLQPLYQPPSAYKERWYQTLFGSVTGWKRDYRRFGSKWWEGNCSRKAMLLLIWWCRLLKSRSDRLWCVEGK